MGRTALASRGHGEGRAALGMGNEIGHAAHRQRRVHHHHQRFTCDASHRHDVTPKIERQVRVQRGIDGVGRPYQQQGVAIGCGARHCRAGRVARPSGLVDHHHGLAQTLRQRRGQLSAQDVVRAAWCKADHQG